MAETNSEPSSTPSASQSQLLSERFLSYVFHELRTPLTVVHSYAQIALDKLPADSQFDRLRVIMQRMVSQSDEIVEMLEELLEASRIPLGRLNLDAGEIEVNEMLEDVIEHLSPETQSKIKYSPLTETAHVRVDMPRLERSVRTLMLFGLAEQQTVEQPAQIEVTGELNHAEAKVKIELKMPGLVLLEGEQQGLFDLYRPIRKDPGKDVKAGVLDIGLYLAQGVVEAHGGQLNYLPALPGFVIDLPLAISR